MRKILILLLFIAMTPFTYAQLTKGKSNTVDNSNYCYITGTVSNPGTGIDVLIKKYDTNGDTLWSRAFSGSDNTLDDEGVGIKTDYYGNVYVVANIGRLNLGYDVVLLKYASDGTFLWSQTFSGWGINTPSDDKAFGIAVDAAGDAYITGYTTSMGATKMFTAKCAPDSTVLWVKFDPNPNYINSQGAAIVFDHSGNVCVTGYTSLSGSTYIYTLKYTNNGQILWSDIHNNELPVEQDKAFGIAVDASDNVIVTGYQTNVVNSSNADIALLKYTSSGSLLWSRYYNGGYDDKAFGIAVDETDAIYITGYTALDTTSTNYITIKYSAAGDSLWGMKYSGPENKDVAKSIGLIKTNGVTTGVVVTGSSMGTSGNNDYVTVDYAVSNGTELMESRYSSGPTSNDVAQQLAVSPNGTVYVTGYSVLIINAKPITSLKTQSLNWGAIGSSNTINSIPSVFALYQNYPNPFNPSTKIKFDLPTGASVRLAVYDILGKEVSKITDQYFQAGTHEITFSNTNLSSGIYFYELRTNGFRDVKKMSLIK